MAPKRTALTIYRIRDTIDGKRVEKYEDAIAEPNALVKHDLIGSHDFDARLFVAKSKKKEPPWVAFLQPGFGSLPEVAEAVTNSAVLIAKVAYGEDCFFALPFGFGRHLLKRNSFEQNYGLRVTLNLLYPRDGADGAPSPARIRRVDAKTVAANTIHTRRQADRRAAFEDFGVDVQRDLLRAVTGRPVDTETWGTRLTGAGALRLNCVLDIEELGALLRRIEETSRRDDYQERFAWVDNVRTVTDPVVIANLEKLLLNHLRNKDVDRLALAPPELVDWDGLDHFRVSAKRKEQHDDLDIEHFLQVLEGADKLATLTIQQLRKTHRIEAVGVDDRVYSWPAFRCISGELELNGETYLVSGGDFFGVSNDYIEDLNAYIRQLRECDKELPDATLKMTEGAYNQSAAESSPHYLLLDRKIVRLDARTSPIEVCDILTEDGSFIHVKRKLASASLSHLFAQGYTSSDLFYMSPQYREAALAKIKQAEEERANETGDAGYRGRFSSFDTGAILPSHYEVVYAIVANWKGREFADALPFFSKVNLRRHVRDLRRMGYEVSYKRVQAD